MDEKGVEQDVEGARAAATSVVEARKKAADAKDKSLQLANLQDGWAQAIAARELSKNAEEIKAEALRAYGEASDRWRAVMDATNAYPRHPLSVSACRAAKCAYRKANADMNAVSELVYDVEQNCKKYYGAA